MALWLGAVKFPPYPTPHRRALVSNYKQLQKPRFGVVSTKSDITHGQYLAEIEVSILDRADSPPDVTPFEVEDADGNQFVLSGVADRANSLVIGESYRIEHGLGIDPGFDARETFPDQFNDPGPNEWDAAEFSDSPLSQD